MTLNLKRQPPWLLDGTYYRSLPTNDERAGGEEPFRNCVVSLHVAKSDDEESGEDGLTQVGTAFAVPSARTTTPPPRTVKMLNSTTNDKPIIAFTEHSSDPHQGQPDCPKIVLTSRIEALYLLLKGLSN